MKKSRIYENATAVPIDRVAARVTAKGVSYEPDKKIDQRHWEAPPKVQPVPEGATNLMGTVFGRFTVIGYFRSHPKRGSAWLVRCACGDYETRYKKAIQNPANKEDCCDKCRHLLYLKRSEEFWRTGKNKD